jgi:DNA adenine methylase
MSLFDLHEPERIINVASVPQRSPFRYPGGKTWLIPRIRQWICSLPTKPRLLIEPFAGGGIVSLTAVFENLVEQALMVELDAQVASVWQAILNGDAQWLAQRIVEFDLNSATLQATLSAPSTSLREAAFQTLLRNRTNHGGILAPGSGRVKYGENGKGITSRWYPATLRKRLLDIDRIKDRLLFAHGDGMQTLYEHIADRDSVCFIDPPYTAAGKRAGSRLYTHNELNHAELFRTAAQLSSDFLMTYDNAPELVEMAHRHHFATQEIPMKNTHHARMTELLIGRDLSWLQ